MDISERVYKGIRITDRGDKYLLLTAELASLDDSNFRITLDFTASEEPFEGQSVSSNQTLILEEVI